ncbi:RBBP9/YdeN family alpha/beta hydrolase, partial [Priestia megaterium]
MGKQVYIIHGYGASPSNHWFPWLKEKLIADNHQVSVLHMPNSSDPKKEEWLKTLANKIKNLDNNAYFVAHSLGSITL